jgi:hypothetical protein
MMNGAVATRQREGGEAAEEEREAYAPERNANSIRDFAIILPVFQRLALSETQAARPSPSPACILQCGALKRK